MILTLDQCVDITWTKGEPPRGVFRRRVLDEKEGIVVEAEVTRLVPNLSHLERSVVTCQMPKDNAQGDCMLKSTGSRRLTRPALNDADTVSKKRARLRPSQLA
jgi:hypothetical protein